MVCKGGLPSIRSCEGELGRQRIYAGEKGIHLYYPQSEEAPDLLLSEQGFVLGDVLGEIDEVIVDAQEDSGSVGAALSFPLRHGIDPPKRFRCGEHQGGHPIGHLLAKG